MKIGIASALFHVAVAVHDAAAQEPFATEWLTAATDPRNRVNLVILGEGYTAEPADQSKMRVDAARMLETLFSVAPYTQLRPLFTAKLVHLLSADSTASGTPGVTALSAKLCNGCIAWDKVTEYENRYFPEVTYGVVLINDTSPQSIFPSYAAGNTAVVPSLNGSPTISHELGHAAGGLADEYFDSNTHCDVSGCGEICDPSPNVTTQTDRARVKWKAWIDPETPVPTPSNQGWTGIGVFEGGQYCATGIYRPQERGCIMGAYADGKFCSVCAEALLTRILGRVKLVDGSFPAPSKSTLTREQAGAFSISLAPVELAAITTWSVDGAVQGESSTALTLPPGALADGEHSVTATVQYGTPLVRSDPQGALRTEIRWGVSVVPGAAAAIRPWSSMVPPRGAAIFTATGPGAPYAFSLVANRSGGAITADGHYTAGPTGNVVDVIQVTDDPPYSPLVNVAVSAGVTVAPAVVAVKPGEGLTFAAAGGSGVGFAWSCSGCSSGGRIDAVTGEYVAGATGLVTDLVRVTDSLGNTASARASVSRAPASRSGCATGSGAAGAVLLLLAGWSGARRMSRVRAAR